MDFDKIFETEMSQYIKAKQLNENITTSDKENKARLAHLKTLIDTAMGFAGKVSKDSSVS